ncbi:MAG TPA: class I SAM-dependent methyltransferase [Myxococcales bacterium]|nr:class I SAM-dependent methyltransferase [Myxococcales bacterium]
MNRFDRSRVYSWTMNFLRRVRKRLRSLRRVEHHAPLGHAIQDHQESGTGEVIEVLRSDGLSYSISSEEFFSLGGRLEELDQLALRRAHGRVLDVGAGAGRHALALQKLDHEVVALDISPLCVEVMRQRGVAEALVGDIFELKREKSGDFDTVLFLMQNIGISGSLFGLEKLLLSLRPLIRPGGQILFDSSPLLEFAGDSPDMSEGIDVYFSYDGYRGRSFSWLYLDEKTLVDVAARLGWELEILARMTEGEYLARLRPPEDETRNRP